MDDVALNLTPAASQTQAVGESHHPRQRRAKSRRGEGAALRDEILDVAEVLLFETADAETVSIRAIGHRVGVSAPSIYRHFPDKDELIRAVCVRGFERMHQLFDLRLSGLTDPIERIRALAGAYAEFALGNPAQYRVLLMSPNIGHHEPGHVPQFEDREHEMGGLHRLIESVELAMKAECFRLTEPWPIALHLWTSVHGMVSLRIAEPEMPWPPIDEQLQVMFSILRDGLVRRS